MKKVICTACKCDAKKQINKEPGEILGKYVCGCENGPTFPLIELDKK